ncbi:hypothetical protein GEMRC1_011779 [Eukaryota sp. GEM-RC1]
MNCRAPNQLFRPGSAFDTNPRSSLPQLKSLAKSFIEDSPLDSDVEEHLHCFDDVCGEVLLNNSKSTCSCPDHDSLYNSITVLASAQTITESVNRGLYPWVKDLHIQTSLLVSIFLHLMELTFISVSEVNDDEPSYYLLGLQQDILSFSNNLDR